MGNTPRYVGFLDPPYNVTLTDDSGAAINLTGCTSNSFTLTMLNPTTNQAQQGVGSWTVTNATGGQASYQWTTNDLATAGVWWVYTTVKLPAEPSLREFDPELITILPGTVGAGAAPPGVTPVTVPAALYYNVVNYGADAAGNTDATSAFQAAVNAMPTVTVNNGTSSTTYHIGALFIPAGTYKLGSSGDIGNIGPFVSILGPGSTACILYDYGQTSGGACLSMHNAIRPSSDTFDTMLSQSAPVGIAGTITGFTIDGTHAGAGRSGLDIGDFEGLDLRDLKIQHYNLAGSSGFNMNNKYSWVNSFRGRVAIYDCTTCAFITGNGSPSGDIFDSFNDLEFLLYAFAGQDGVVLNGGVQFLFGSLKIWGNFMGSGSAQTNAALRITGSGQSTPTAIAQSHLQIFCEGGDAGGSNGPYTIYYGDVSSGSRNGIYGCEGMLVFHNRWRNSNWSINNSFAQGNFTFAGIIYGDANLGSAGGASTNPGATFMGGIAYPLSEGFAGGGQPLEQGDFFNFTLTANCTMALQNSYAAPQRKTFLIQQAASGGPYTVTWPKPGSPTLGSPAVYWAGGTAPTMSTGANAVDKYFLETLDGIHWYGTAAQNLS